MQNDTRGCSVDESLHKNCHPKPSFTTQAINPDSSTTFRPPKSKSFSQTKKRPWYFRGTSSVVSKISQDKLSAAGDVVSSASGSEFLCSYNWIESEKREIFVPGSPPIYHKPPEPFQVPPDSGVQYVDRNAFKCPEYPFDPLFAALSCTRSDFKFDDVDLLTNRNSLRKLLDFINGKARGAFRIDIGLVGKTLILQRHEKTASTLGHPLQNARYGYGFEAAITKPKSGLKNSGCHQRVVKYKIGRLTCVVRMEVDACIGDAEPAAKTDQIEELTQNLDVILKNPATVKSESNNAKRRGYRYRGIDVTFSGEQETPVIPAEIKSMKMSRFKEKPYTPQLWFGRTQVLIKGKHTDGQFDEIEEVNTEEMFASWERNNQLALQKLVQLLVELRDIASRKKSEKLAIVFEPGQRPLTMKILEVKEQRQIFTKQVTKHFWTVPT